MIFCYKEKGPRREPEPFKEWSGGIGVPLTSAPTAIGTT